MAAGNSVFSPVTMKGVTPVNGHPPWSWITAPLPCQGLYPPSFPPFCCPIHTPPPPPGTGCVQLPHPQPSSLSVPVEQGHFSGPSQPTC